MTTNLQNLTNVIPKELFGTGVVSGSEVSMNVSATGIILQGDLNTASPITATISQAGIITDNPAGFDILSSLNMNQQNITNVYSIINEGNDLLINTGATATDIVINAGSVVSITGDAINLNPTTNISINNPNLSKIQFNTATSDPASIYQDDAGDLYISSNSSNFRIENTFGGIEISGGDYLHLSAPSDIEIKTTGAGGTYLTSDNLDVVCSAPNGGIALEASLVNILSQTTSSVVAPSGFYVGLTAFTTGDGTINGNLNGKVNLTTSSSNQSYTLLVADANTGNQNIKGSGSDLNYNPVSQTLSVKNMIVSGNETQTGIITTNVLKTDIMYQQVSYTNTAVVSIPTTTALLAYGTFFMSVYDTGSTLANSVVQYIFPTLPTDGSMDGYTFQLRKLRGGVNQSTQNWIFTAPGNYILPNGNTLNLGSGGAVNNTSPNSFTQRFTIATYASVGYYVGCNN
jgi:hypothetical protein